MKAVLQVAVGSGLGSGLRFICDAFGKGWDPGGFPWITFFINISGSLLIGFLIGRHAREKSTAGFFCTETFWVTGFCGGFTTFSAFSWQTLDLIHRGEAGLAAMYAGVSIFAGVAAVALGMVWGRSRKTPPRP